MHSRFSNLAGKVKRNQAQEVARIKALMVPSYFFLIEKFESEDFRTARQYLQNFIDIGKNSQFIRIQTTNDIKLAKVIEQLQQNFTDNFDDYDVPRAFVDKDLPAQITDLNRYFDRIKVLTDEQLAKTSEKTVAAQIAAISTDLDTLEMLRPLAQMGTAQSNSYEQLQHSVTTRLQGLTTSFPGREEIIQLVEKSQIILGNDTQQNASDTSDKMVAKQTGQRPR